MNLLVHIKNFNGKLPETSLRDSKGNPVWHTHSIMNLIIPHITMIKNNSEYDSNGSSENKMIIEEGQMNRCVLDKSILGTKSQGLIHVISNDLTTRESKNFIDDLQNLITNWLLTSGFSVGISDIIVDDDTEEQLVDKINTKKKEVIELIDSIHRGTFENA